MFLMSLCCIYSDVYNRVKYSTPLSMVNYALIIVNEHILARYILFLCFLWGLLLLYANRISLKKITKQFYAMFGVTPVTQLICGKLHYCGGKKIRFNVREFFFFPWIPMSKIHFINDKVTSQNSSQIKCWKEFCEVNSQIVM